jgi:alcohol dehydrogenase class IV
VADRAKTLPFQRVEGLAALKSGIDTLIVIGGGSLLDEAKAWRVERSPGTRLIAIASLWGSGAEVSPVVVLDSGSEKDIRIGNEYIPDVNCHWPELAETIPPHLAKTACGDVWAHALEGFLSPLANDEVQTELAAVIRDIVTLPLGNDPRWFNCSARACAGQTRSSVGLVHGIAHTLEGPLRQAFPDTGWGHAMLCSVFLWPVMSFNRASSDKWQRRMDGHGLDESAIFSRLEALHDSDTYEQALESLDRHWLRILRDPCSRTNSTLVKPASKSFFLESQFR